MENWRHYLAEEKQTQLWEQYFDDDNLLTEEQELELLSEFDFLPDPQDAMNAIRALGDGLSGILSRGDKVADVVGQVAVSAAGAPQAIADTAASSAEISTNVFKSVESIVGLLGSLYIPGFGVAFVAYKVFKLVFEYILKRKVLSLEEMKEKFKNPEAVEQLKGELTDALEKEPGLMTKILSPLKKIMSKVKKMMSFFSRKKDSDEDVNIGVEDDAPESV